MPNTYGQPLYYFETTPGGRGIVLFGKPDTRDGVQTNVAESAIPHGLDFRCTSIGVFAPAGEEVELTFRIATVNVLQLPAELCRIDRAGDRGFILDFPITIRPSVPIGGTIIWRDQPKSYRPVKLGVVLFGVARSF